MVDITNQDLADLEKLEGILEDNVYDTSVLKRVITALVDNQMSRPDLLEHLLTNGVDFTEDDVVLPYGWEWSSSLEKISRIVSVNGESADICVVDLLDFAKHKLMNNGVI